MTAELKILPTTVVPLVKILICFVGEIILYILLINVKKKHIEFGHNLPWPYFATYASQFAERFRKTQTLITKTVNSRYLEVEGTI